MSRAAVETLNALPEQLEAGTEQRTVGQALLAGDLGVAEDRAVELDRLLEVVDEPEGRCDGGHVLLLLTVTRPDGAVLH